MDFLIEIWLKELSISQLIWKLLVSGRLEFRSSQIKQVSGESCTFNLFNFLASYITCYRIPFLNITSPILKPLWESTFKFPSIFCSKWQQNDLKETNVYHSFLQGTNKLDGLILTKCIVIFYNSLQFYYKRNLFLLIFINVMEFMTNFMAKIMVH